MAIKFSEEVRNDSADAKETTIGTAPILRLRTGAPPSGIGDADTGDVAAEITLPSDWLSAASGGAKSLLGTWEVASAAGAGTNVGHFRLYKSDGTTVAMQGTVSESGGGGDMIIDNVSINAGQKVRVDTFTWTEAHA